MNNHRSIPGLAGLLFGGGGGGGAGGRLHVRGHPSPPAPVKCPRCDSTNTKFCYYNNYNLAQPRHFCKACRRYWTKGGILRNVPIGGGCRKSKHSSSTSKPSGGLPSAKEPSPSGCSDGLNSASTETSNPDANPNPTTYFGQEGGGTPLVAEVEFFAETTLSPVSAPTILNSFGAPLPILLQCRSMESEIGAQPGFMHQASPLIPLLTTEEGELQLPLKFMNPAPPQQIQSRPISVEEVTAQTSFLDQAVVDGLRWTDGAADPAIYGLSTQVGQPPAAAGAYWSDCWSDPDPASFLLN
ncbi:dof zinc finger protein 4-like [Zingiber officinale]|uniref:Dof zinc finger protein n=1 Tax=Zingiber officinale TaxID=94328 RepID=A0A8J5G677_ZINOF|nr:dof zinc finger protein 4-like [Zingiber officinale]KAG6500601.1 hypothetical protein ZIOFF_040449 [Zingiber officinale]